VEKTLRDQLVDVENALEAEKQKGAQKDQDEVTRLETKQAELLTAIMDEEQEAVAMVKIETDTLEITSFLDTLVIEGLPMRELTAGENEYQMLRIAVETKLIEQSVKAASEVKLINLQHQEDLRAAADRELQLKRQNDELQAKIEAEMKQAQDDAVEYSNLLQQIAKLELDKQDADSKRDAAVRDKESLEELLAEKQNHIETLRAEIAVGAVRATQVIDQSAQLKEIADKIKASRIHVYDVVPDNEYAPKNFTAKRTDNGKEVSYNWTQARNYIVVTDEEEVSRFRTEHATQSVVSDSALDETAVNLEEPEALQMVEEATTPLSEETFRPEEVQTVPDPMDRDSVVSESYAETVSRQEFETLKGKVEHLYRVANISEVA
jgi:hypothetical protein